MSDLLEQATWLDSLGFNLVPAKYRGKRPVVEWRQFQHKRSTPQLGAWFRGGNYNIWMVTGTISRVVVLDIDSDEAAELWAERLGEQLEVTTCVQTGSGKHHYWFSLAEGDSLATWAKHDPETGIDFDVRGDGSGVIVPPSIHECGGQYEWIRGPEQMLPVPQALRGGSGATAGGAGVRSSGDGGHPAVRSMLAELLGRPPAEGGRNDWLTKVAGHLARMVPYEDAYDALLEMANSNLESPLAADELSKIQRSIWSTEQRRDRSTDPSEENGWLTSDGHRLYTLCSRGKGDDAEIYAAPWSDFDIRVLGVIEDDQERSYSVELIRGEDRRRTLLEPNKLGRPAELHAWLAAHGCTILPPGGEMHRGSPSARLQRYMESQDAPRSMAVRHLGWNDAVGGFITHEGVMTPTGLEPHEGVQPHPRLREWAPFRYGQVDPDTARSVLSDVLEFHEKRVCAVFGAWWAACFVKAQIMQQTSLFPFMALEAPSESGKTTGFFALMIELNGNHGGHGEYTIPYLRDMASAHRNGIVWVDDMSDINGVLDLLRQATSEGSRGKKGQDRTKQETVQLLAPVAVSGEGLGALELEKALLDRAIRLEVGSPKGRMSVKGPERPQWDDIRDLQTEWENDLTQVAGTLVQMALGQVGQVERLRELRSGSGRHADKQAILRVGARILAAMLGHDEDDSWIVDEVDEWCEGAPDLGSENVLTTTILPRLLSSDNMPRSAAGYVPVFVDQDGIVWYSEVQVAERWRQMADTPREKQLGSESSLRLQRQALGVEGTGRRYDITTGRVGRVQRRYHNLPADISEKVVRRTQMEYDDGDDGKLL